MKKFEYRTVTSTAYNKCLDMANSLLTKVSTYTQKSITKISPVDIICYFEDNFNILFVFFETETTTAIKYKDIVLNSKYKPLNLNLVNRISGATIPKSDRHVIMLNQSMPKTRIFFTILHELSHLYFHDMNKNKQIFASKFSGIYPTELMPFENEANIIASLLFCSTSKLEALLTKNYSFDKIKSLSGMSAKGLHSRLLNYLHHILGLSNSKALELILRLRDGDYKTINEIKYLVNRKNNQFQHKKIISIKTSIGNFIDKESCITFLKRLSNEELVNELDYAHSTKNQPLEILVINEFNQKS